MRSFVRPTNRHPRNWKKLLWILAVLLLVGWGGSQVLARSVTVTRNLQFDQCRLDYGQSLGGWDGSTEDAWNHKDYRYEQKLFKIEAAAPEGFFKNVKQVNQHRIISKDCGDDLIDTASEAYLWNGAKPTAVRLGAPNAGDANNKGRYELNLPQVRTDEALIPPLSKQSFNTAAAWVDDTAAVTIDSADGSKSQELWCHDNNVDELCGFTDSGQLKRGEGYLFVGDNCPEDLDCNQSTSWYGGFGKVREDISDLVGRDERGELLPFRLSTQAASDYGYKIGAFTVLTFKYPKTPEVIANITIDPAKAEPGGNYSVNLALSKIGPNLGELTVQTNFDGVPVKASSGLIITTEDLAKINNNQTVKVGGKFKLTGGEAGKCYTGAANLTAKSVLGEEIKIAPLSLRFCIQSPIVATYTYDVTTRGSVSGLDEFIELTAETLAAAKGWAKAGVRFRRVASGGDFTLVLSEASQMSSFSSGCDANWSCQVGRYVIINYNRWRFASEAWNEAGGSLRDYRHMVMNHETGHWLGFGHYSCPAVGAAAPVMQQQSISLQGCKFNPWPTASEITTLKSRL